MNTHSGFVNSYSGATGKVFTINQNQRSSSFRKAVHVGPEYAGSATLQKDDGGDPKIVGRIEGVRYTIDFFGCVKGRQCDDILLRASWGDASVELTDVNQWNSGVKFGRGYLDDDNDPVVEIPIIMQGGVSQKNLDDSFDYWRIVLQSFREMLKEKSSGATGNNES